MGKEYLPIEQKYIISAEKAIYGEMDKKAVDAKIIFEQVIREASKVSEEVEALLAEPNSVSSRESEAKKKVFRPDAPIYTFFKGSGDGDGGSPTGKEKHREKKQMKMRRR